MCQKKIDPLLTPYTEINSKEARYKSLSEISDLGMSKELLDTIPKAQIHKRKKNWYIASYENLNLLLLKT